MNKIFKNIKRGWVTSIFGILFLLAALIIMIFPIFKNEFEVDSVVLIIGATIGVGLLLSPDDLFTKLKDKL